MIPFHSAEKAKYTLEAIEMKQRPFSDVTVISFKETFGVTVKHVVNYNNAV